MKSMKSKKDLFLFLQEAITQNNSLSQSKNTQNEKEVKTSCQWKEIKKEKNHKSCQCFLCVQKGFQEGRVQHLAEFHHCCQKECIGGGVYLRPKSIQKPLSENGKCWTL